MILARCLSGAMNGNVAVMKSVMAEITDETNEAQAFALLPMCYALGSIIGPTLGGYLARPAEQYPNIFGHIEFLKAFPYFLPCFIASCANLFAILLGLFFLPETLASKVKRQHAKNKYEPLPTDEENGQVNAASTLTSRPCVSDFRIKQEEAPPRIRDLMTPQAIMVILVFGLLAFQDSGFGVIVPLFAYTRIEDGGIGFSFNGIGTALSINGVAAVIIQLGIFPPLQRRFGTLHYLRTGLLLYPLVAICFPFLNRMARNEEGWSTPWGVWVLLMSTLLVRTMASTSFVCINLMVNNSAPTKSSLGIFNGLSQSASSLAQTIGPIFISSLFAVSITRHILGGHLVWVVLFCLSCAICVTTWFLKEPKASWHRAPRSPKLTDEPAGIDDEDDGSSTTSDIDIEGRRERASSFSLRRQSII